MDGSVLVSHFGRMGARVRVREDFVSGLRLDIAKDGDGQFFDVFTGPGVDARVVDVDAQMRHLLLLGIDPNGRKTRFLCGHDEREWFVAAVPGRSVSNVRGALEALKPALVHLEQHRKGLRTPDRFSRRNQAFTRQGEWFFVPRPNLVVKDWLVLRNEPLSRGRGKPHWVEFLYREGGETVMVSSRHRSGLTLAHYRELIRSTPEASSWNWLPMRRNPTAFVKGSVRHPDHATIRLDVWHQVAMNTEGDAPGARNVVFLD